MGLFNKRIAYQQAQNDLRILKDCERILLTTKNEDVFYSRLRLYEETINHLCTLNVKTTGASPFQVKNAFYKDRQELIDQFNTRNIANNPYSRTYYKDMEKLEAAWSVLSNLRVYEGKHAEQFESLCRKNLVNYQNMIGYDKHYHSQSPTPKHVPAYVRLAMLYEKQGKYAEAIDVCVEAIKCNAYDDHTNGKMYGRLARLIRKSGIDVSPDILKLTEAQ